MLFNTKKQKRKEKDSFLAQKHMSEKSIITLIIEYRNSPKFCKKRASLCTFGKTKGSLTVEASLVVPIFLFALIAIIYLMEMLAVQMSVRIGMHSALESIREESNSSSTVSTNEIEAMIVEAIGEEKLEQSIIVEGKDGIDCSETEISTTQGIITLKATYTLKLPVPQFGELGLTYQEEMIAKTWTGYTSGTIIAEEEIVYITDTGNVYHTELTCTHLSLDISYVLFEELDSLRNEYGGIYTSCSKCFEFVNEEELLGTGVYICSSGSNYHSSLSCSGLTRTIYEVPISETIGMGICSRCGGE